MKDRSKGFVAFVGAGPGRPDLLTLRGRDLLQEADMVLVDDLVHPEVYLRWAPATARIIRCGKRGGHPGLAQNEINQLITSAGRAGNCIVRLKGGDPTFFARLQEELVAVQKASLDYEIVPGITAASGLSAYAGCLLTERGVSRSVSLLTGTTSDGEIDWQAAAGMGRIVLYMGTLHAGEHASKLIAGGLAESTACVVVRWATRGFQQCLETTLGQLGARLDEDGIRPPALIVIGAGGGAVYDWFARLPLSGLTLMTNRPDERGWLLADRLRTLGAEVINLPIQRPQYIRQTTRQMAAVELCTSVLAANQIALPPGSKVFAVGKATARALTQRGFVVPGTGHSGAEELADVIGNKGARILRHWTGIPRREEVRNVARKLGMNYLPVPLYRMVLDSFVLSLSQKLIPKLPAGTVFYGSSPETVRRILPELKAAKDLRLWAIGQTTASAMQEMGLVVDHVLAAPGDDALVAALLEAQWRQN